MLRAIKPTLIVAALVTLLAAVAVAAPQVSLPEWAKEAAARPKKTYEPRTNAVVLLNDRTISVTQSGEYTESVRRVVRILRPEGKHEATIGIRVSTGDKILNAHAWCSSPDGHNYEVNQKDFEQRGSFGGGTLYEDVYSSVATAPGGNPGAVVAFEYSLRQRAWGDYETWDIQEDIPVEESRLKLALPAGWNFRSSWINSAPVAPVSTGANEWSWVIRDVAPIDMEEKHRPADRSLEARMQLAFSSPEFPTPVFASWSSIGKWAEDLAQPRREPSLEIKTKVEQLTAGASGFDDTVARLAAFMQREIRYVAIEIGLGGFQPHAAGDVFRNRYGDCKDKATLLGSMLQVAGIRTRNVLIYAGHGVTREDSPGNLFNHEILAIELPATSRLTYHSVVQSKSGQRYLIFDPTNEWVPVGELPVYEQGNFALLTGKDGGELIHLPVFAPEQNRHERNGKFTIAEGGALSGDLQVTSFGSHAMYARETLKNESELERTKSVERFLAGSLQGVTLKEATRENLNTIDKELRSRYSFTASEFLKSTGPLLVFRPCVFGHKAIRLDWKKRKYPVDLESTTQEIDRYEIALPPGLEVDDLPDAVQIDVGFASYKSAVAVSNGVVVYQREYVVRDPLVPVEKLDQFRKLEEAILRDESSSVVVKKKKT